MKTKICVFNDLKVPMSLQIQSAGLSALATGYERIPEGRHSVVDYEIPEGTIPYFKVWATGQALLSYVKPEDV